MIFLNDNKSKILFIQIEMYCRIYRTFSKFIHNIYVVMIW